MSSETRPDFRDLESKGYVVIRSFLGENDLSLIKEDIACNKGVWYESYLVKIPPRELLTRLLAKFEAVTSSVARETNIQANFLIGGVYFFTEGGQSFRWHQDRESYYVSQTHYHYLNFYIPIIKPCVEKSNLSLIPLDRLREKSPDIFEKVLGRGACLIEAKDEKTIFYNENEGGEYGSISYDLSDLAETPELNTGDLLLLRGDVIHKTQDADSDRVALSVRFTNGLHKISKAKLLYGGYKKFTKMLDTPGYYQSILAYFDECGVDEMSFQEFYSEKFSRFCNTCSGSKKDLSKYLILEKLRQGLFVSVILVLLGSVRAIIGRRMRSLRSVLKTLALAAISRLPATFRGQVR